MTSNGSRVTKEMLFNSTVNITKRHSLTRKSIPGASSSGPVNFLEKNKKQVEAKGVPTKVPSKPWANQLRTDKAPVTLAAKVVGVVRAKINTNLRSSSTANT
jgi:hypothetical protein